jgi:energy-coupling factor transport system ATP-binding protein
MPILIEQLTHTYLPGTPMQVVAVDNVSLRIEDGDFMGIIGHTGSGKSTFVQHLNGLLQPTSGRVLVDGIDLAEKATRKQLRARVGMVFQYPEYQLFEETVAKDVAFGPRNLGVPEEEIQQRVRDVLEQVELPYEEYAQKSPFELSGGQKRRVALAGILAMSPSYLVLDEPMAGLDPRGRQEILQLIQRLHGRGITIVMVSHSMDDIAELATRIAVFNDAKLFALGSPEEIFRRTEELISIGLDVPKAARMAALLRARGLDVPGGIFRAQELEEYILERGRRNG